MSRCRITGAEYLRLPSLDPNSYLKSFDFAGVADVWSSTKIDERSASIRRRFVRLDLLLDDALFEGIVGEEIEQLLLGEDASLERLLLLQDRLDDVLDGFEVVAGHLSAGGRGRR